MAHAPSADAGSRLRSDGFEAFGRQHTLAAAVRVEGVGLFTGERSSLTIRPAEAGTGIRFRRADRPGSAEIPALVEHVAAADRRTVLRGPTGETVETVEHCLAALSGLGVDNAVVELEGPECPAGDGSAALFSEPMVAAGLAEQAASRRPITIARAISVEDGSASAALLPPDPTRRGLGVQYTLDYPDEARARCIGVQSVSMDVCSEVFARELAPARTFSTADEALAAREAGLFGHLTASDMLVLGPDGPIDNALRFADEPARHKVVDALGDLALVGRPIRGRLVALRSGHALNHELARAVREQAEEGAGGSGGGGVVAALDVREVLRILPHRYPMMLVDRVVDLEPNRRARAIKNVTLNEPFFQGHYPGAPIMPGVLIVEAMGQTAGLMLHERLHREDRIGVLISIDGVRLRRAVTPGDQLTLEAEALRATSRIGEARCTAMVDGQQVAEATIKFLMVERDRG